MSEYPEWMPKPQTNALDRIVKELKRIADALEEIQMDGYDSFLSRIAGSLEYLCNAELEGGKDVPFTEEKR